MAEAFALNQTFMNREEAREQYGLVYRESPDASDLDRTLASDKVVPIAMPLTDTDFKELTDGYESCIDYCPDKLAETFYVLDRRYGNEVGNARKELKVDPITGAQIEDPKNYIHVTEGAVDRWQEQFATGPLMLKTFFEQCRETQNGLISVARQQISQLEETRPGITELYFPSVGEGPKSRNFLRLLSYDGYVPDESMGAVAKAHNDIGGFTIQAFASAPGFWGAPGGSKSGERIHHDTHDGQAYFFAGATHRKLYGGSDPIQPLWHGVDRIVPVGADYVPKRHTVVMFIDPPRVDAGVTKKDTLPYIDVPQQTGDTTARSIGSQALRIEVA